jgi:UDP-N-acetylmuramoyl-L-alanyl-D-glutamate--2,6-diaminopimelate ligase
MENLKAKLGPIADHVYGHPSHELWIVGVTGTNGKTSCAHWIAAGQNAAGRRCAVLGTLGNGLWGALQPAENTTPDAAEAHELLRALKSAGAESVSMEVSSHGLDQGRVNAIAFDVALFTNLSRDHLDYHGTMAAYGAAKSKLFEWPGLRVGVINADDAFGQSLIDAAHSNGRKVLTYGFGTADIVGTRLAAPPSGLYFAVETPWGRGEVHTHLIWRVQRGESAGAGRAARERRDARAGARFPRAGRSATGTDAASWRGLAARRRRLRPHARCAGQY